MSPDILKQVALLPIQLQLVLGAGYCAYLIAYVGIRQHHKVSDTIFASLSFGLTTAVILAALGKQSAWIQFSAAVVGTLFVGAIWRGWIRGWIKALYRHSNYSWSDDTISAWEHLQENSRHRPSQITIELDDGRFLYCTNTSRVAEMPFGPFVLGTSGDALLYVDRSERPGEAPQDVAGVFDEDWGNLITYVPKERIKKLSIRYN